MIPYGRQEITQSDIDAVIEVLRSDYLTQGPMVPFFEKTVAAYTSSKYAVATNSATSALHLACLSLGVKEGDVVWTSPITFVASANCALYCGAEIDFVDIDPNTYNLCSSKLEEKLAAAKKNGEKLPKVVILVHLCGQSCDMEAIYALSKTYGFRIIEDASHAVGGKYKNAPIGNCFYSDICVFSFHPVKVITTGEGGVALTNDKGLASKMELLRTHGITKNPDLMSQEMEGSWYYEQIDLGYNYRMTDMQAALGVSQMERLDSYVAQRHKIAKYYNELILDDLIVKPYQHPDCYSAFHLYPIRIRLDKTEKAGCEIFEFLREHGVGVNRHYIPVHTQPYYKSLGFKKGDFPVAEKYYSETISLPVFPSLTHKQQEYIVEGINKAIG